jgi:hypothetical protein
MVMFDLMKSTADWLGDLRQSEAFEETDLEELENHLRDEIEQLMDKGLSEKEAFWVATNRAGTREELPSEYAKVNSRAVWRHRFLWMAVGVLGYLLVSTLIAPLSWGAAVAMVSSGIGSDTFLLLGTGMDLPAIVSLSVQLLLTCLALACLYLALSRDSLGFSSRLGKARRSRPRTMILYAVAVALMPLLVMLQVVVRIIMTRWLTVETFGMASAAASAGAVTSSILLAVFLVSMVFVLSRPRKTGLQASPGR